MQSPGSVKDPVPRIDQGPAGRTEQEKDADPEQRRVPVVEEGGPQVVERAVAVADLLARYAACIAGVTPFAPGAIEEATGMPCAMVRSGGAIPLVTALAKQGIPTVVSGCALPSDRIHAPDEHLRVEQYELGVRMARAILTAFGGL